MRDSVKLRAYAKLNLLHLVLFKRKDGFHQVLSLLQTVSLCDNITIQKTRTPEIKVTWQPEEALDEEKPNLCCKAAEHFFGLTKLKSGVHIHIQKQIPVGGGMGGGSSDAAATLLGLCRLFDVNMNEEALDGLAKKLGSDVSFFLRGGTALAGGRGERISPFPKVSGVFFLVVFPGFSHSTQQVYERSTREHRTHLQQATKAVKRMEHFIKTKNLLQLGDCFHNDLQGGVGQSKTSIEKIKKRLMRAGALGASMTGSGSCVFGMFKAEKSAVYAQRQFPGLKSWVVHPVDVGIQLIK